MPKKPGKMPPRKSKTSSGRKIEYLDDDNYLDAAELATDLRKIDAIENEIEECRVNFRWDNEHLRVVKRAALALKIPYQRYIKEVVFAQAMADLQISKETFANSSTAALTSGDFLFAGLDTTEKSTEKFVSENQASYTVNVPSGNLTVDNSRRIGGHPGIVSHMSPDELLDRIHSLLSQYKELKKKK